MPNQNDHQLIDYLDEILSEQERREVEKLIHTNHKTYEQWSYLKLSVEAIEHAALYKQVGAVRQQYFSQQQQPTGKTGSMKKFRFMFAAAAVLVLAVGLSIYKYATTTAIALYEKSYSPYHLTIERDVRGVVQTIDTLYQQKNWPAVIAQVNNTPEKDTKGLFLAAMAHMELKQYADAASKFKQLQLNNAQTGSDYFEDESDYYLAMSYLALGQSKQAVELLQKIRSEKAHVFNQPASRISGIELTILESKSGR